MGKPRSRIASDHDPGRNVDGLRAVIVEFCAIWLRDGGVGPAEELAFIECVQDFVRSASYRLLLRLFGDAMADEYADKIACGVASTIFATRDATDSWVRRNTNHPGYLFNSARNGVIDAIRATRQERRYLRTASDDRRPEGQEDRIAGVPDPLARSPEDEAIGRDYERILQMQFGGPVTAVLMGEITQAEYAKVMGISQPTVTRKMKKIRAEAALLLKLRA